MQYLPFEITNDDDGFAYSETPCDHRGDGVAVGSLACQACSHCAGINTIDRQVKCTFSAKKEAQC